MLNAMIKFLCPALLLGLNLLGAPAMATEEPPFTVSVKQGDFEVRDYPALVAAEVSVSGDRKDAASKGFRLLAGYIFGGNTRQQSIAMTAPVVQAPAASEKIAMTAPVTQEARDNGSWTIAFTMPAGSTLQSLPAPVSPFCSQSLVRPGWLVATQATPSSRQNSTSS